MNDIPAAVRQAAAAAQSRPLDQDKLAQVRELVIAFRALEEKKSDLEERLKETNRELQEMQFKTLPDAFDQSGVSSLGVEADGNHPAFEAKAQPYYRANIAADWEPKRREAAFSLLKSLGHEDLIKTEVIVSFARGEAEKAGQLLERLTKVGYSPWVKEGVSWQTLTAWLKEQVEQRNNIPPLEPLGATVGRVVKIKELG